MGHYGTWVLARSTDDLLVSLSEIRAAFGSRWWELAETGDGWQLLRVMPQEHEWPILTGDLDAVIAVTGGPVLAGWVSESACVRLVAATPSGFSWTKHLPDGEDCGYDHWEFTTLRVPDGVPVTDGDAEDVVGDALRWAAEANLSAVSRDGIERAMAQSGHERFTGLVDALGLADRKLLPRRFEHREPDWRQAWDVGWSAGLRACRRWTMRRSGEDPWEEDAEQPADADYFRFMEDVAMGIYGQGRTREELVDDAARLAARWNR